MVTLPMIYGSLNHPKPLQIQLFALPFISSFVVREHKRLQIWYTYWS